MSDNPHRRTFLRNASTATLLSLGGLSATGLATAETMPYEVYEPDQDETTKDTWYGDQITVHSCGGVGYDSADKNGDIYEFHISHFAYESYNSDDNAYEDLDGHRVDIDCNGGELITENDDFVATPDAVTDFEEKIVNLAEAVFAASDYAGPVAKALDIISTAEQWENDGDIDKGDNHDEWSWARTNESYRDDLPTKAHHQGKFRIDTNGESVRADVETIINGQEGPHSNMTFTVDIDADGQVQIW